MIINDLESGMLHPKIGKISLEGILRSFDKSEWLYPSLRHRKFKITYVGSGGRKEERVNRVKAFYCQLYKARNDFLHGNGKRKTSSYRSEWLDYAFRRLARGRENPGCHAIYFCPI